ncbi:MAG: hypothetical protein M3Q05_03395, partial [Bacteroidota bacterium]|nr:hypothetical protein [Bacteroidota bacterium]
SFEQLGNALFLTDEELCHSLQDLVVRGYVKCFFPDPDTEVEYDKTRFSKECKQYFFLATKAGLMVHNSR